MPGQGRRFPVRPSISDVGSGCDAHIAHTCRRTLPVSIRCNQQRAAHANPSKRKTSMARSLTKATELTKTDRRTAMAEKEVEALKFREAGHPGRRKCAEEPCRTLVLTSHQDPCEDISFARFGLQVVIDELAEAQASLASVLRFRDHLKMDLADDSYRTCGSRWKHRRDSLRSMSSPRVQCRAERRRPGGGAQIPDPTPELCWGGLEFVDLTI